jgi:hypothetical protein
LHNVQLNPSTGPAFTVDHAANLELDGVEERTPLMNMPVIRLDNSPGAIVRNSRAFAGTGVFLSAGKGQLHQTILEGNALKNAATSAEESTADADSN